jgi:DNA-binding transcriptional ArsR family regulator
MTNAEMDVVFQAIAHPTRRALLDALRPGERAVKDLAIDFLSSRPAVSQHLRVLLEAGLVSERKTGRERLYRLEAAPLADANAWLSSYEQFWTETLAQLT